MGSRGMTGIAGHAVVRIAGYALVVVVNARLVTVRMTVDATEYSVIIGVSMAI